MNAVFARKKKMGFIFKLLEFSNSLIFLRFSHFLLFHFQFYDYSNIYLKTFFFIFPNFKFSFNLPLFSIFLNCNIFFLERIKKGKIQIKNKKFQIKIKSKIEKKNSNATCTIFADEKKYIKKCLAYHDV